LLGWSGFWLQIFFGVIPLLVVIVNVVFKLGQWSGNGIIWVLGLAIACTIILLFSIYWCFRYTRLARRLETGDFVTTKAAIVRALKLGLLANLGIMIFSVAIALWRVGQLTIQILSLPPGAMVVAPNQGGFPMGQTPLLSPANMIAIQAMVNAIAAGLVGTIIALLLLFQIGRDREGVD
jgi:hypothetical protein